MHIERRILPGKKNLWQNEQKCELIEKLLCKIKNALRNFQRSFFVHFKLVFCFFVVFLFEKNYEIIKARKLYHEKKIDGVLFQYFVVTDALFGFLLKF